MRHRELVTLFDYMYWAHRRVLTTAARLTDAQFRLPSVIAGRDLRATLVHTLDVEMSWRCRLRAVQRTNGRGRCRCLTTAMSPR